MRTNRNISDTAEIMANAILVLNAGSSSLKFAVFQHKNGLPPLLRGNISSLDKNPQMKIMVGDSTQAKHVPLDMESSDIKGAMELAVDEISNRSLAPAIKAVGHRIVHGGSEFTRPTVLDASVIDRLLGLVPLAPMHQPRNLEIIDGAARAFPKAIQFGCFDTSFHFGRPRLATLYGLPRALEQEGLKSYGFHGISYAYIASQLKSRHGAKAGGRLIVAHLGSGSSLCAMKGGKSVATTMGFSTLDGLIMSTRCGSIDPGVVLHLLQQRGMSVEEVVQMLYNEAGMLGVSGVSGDMQALIDSDEPSAKEAVDLFVYRAGREIGSMAAALSGLDTLVFCAGIGENSPLIRQRIGEAARWLGVEIDAQRNWRGDERISAARSAVEVLVIPTDEEKAVAVELTKLPSDTLSASRANV
ncbi:acetate kinase [Phyllobacterium trifolii]|uniref:Acetate kinase n=1 Tax=Phyllobacterium trifolii TaxID=300193 RepID=A0A839U8L8_9HYPH|nr:acetate/propionate family kinase [Phyllobacterium trifolii]MBB3146857.1 acetate kinase [Phyllobacterium trifolii]